MGLEATLTKDIAPPAGEVFERSPFCVWETRNIWGDLKQLCVKNLYVIRNNISLQRCNPSILCRYLFVEDLSILLLLILSGISSIPFRTDGGPNIICMVMFFFCVNLYLINLLLCKIVSTYLADRHICHSRWQYITGCGAFHMHLFC